MKGRHGNFRDPVGLIRRTLVSGHRAGRATMAREALRYLVKPLDWALSPWEHKRVRAAVPQDPPIVLIVGAPRSGSTLLYEVLATHLPVSYPSNLTDLFPRAPITATARLSRRARRTVDYQFYFGNTRSLGSPSPAFSLWNRWLGDDRYTVPAELPPEAAADMQSFFAAWASEFDGPFLNKNNRNTAALRLLASYLPNARFIVMRRAPHFVAQSLLEARETVQGDRAIGWGLGSDYVSTGDPFVDVAAQVLRVESMLERELEAVDADRVAEVAYTDLCQDPAGVVSRIASWLDLKPRRLEALSTFEATDRPRLAGDEFDRLQLEIKRRFSTD